MKTIAAILAFAAFQPTPIGATPEYQPPARWPLAGAAGFGGLRGNVQEGARMHLELFANQQVIVVPGGIGVSGGRTTLYGNVVDALWHAPAWSRRARRRHPSRARRAHARATCSGSGAPTSAPTACSRSTGRSARGSTASRAPATPRTSCCSDRDQVVLVHGGDVEIHRSFAFKPVRL